MNEKKPAFRIVRANGGFLRHLLPSGTQTSMCGHTPRSPRGHMFLRAEWTNVESAPITRDCEKCKKALRKWLKDEGANDTEADAFVHSFYPEKATV